jgi:hypothetical protein
MAATVAIFNQFIVISSPGNCLSPGLSVASQPMRHFFRAGLIRLVRRVQRDYVHDDNKHAH